MSHDGESSVEPSCISRLLQPLLSQIESLFSLSWLNVHSVVMSRRCSQGQCFVAINPENFADGFNDRMADLLSIQRGLEPVSRS